MFEPSIRYDSRPAETAGPTSSTAPSFQARLAAARDEHRAYADRFRAAGCPARAAAEDRIADEMADYLAIDTFATERRKGFQ